jgi:choline-sulfatase
MTLKTAVHAGILIACMSLAVLGYSQVGQQRPPNVIFIMSDDQGQWTLGCYGNKEIRTPNLDRLAGEGVRFTRAFCSTPVCSPSRATFLTGRIPSQHGIHDWIDKENTGPAAKEFLRDEIGYSQILAQNGYTCGFSGKWHMGDSLRKQQGFTSWFVHPRGGGTYLNHPMIDGDREIPGRGYLTDVITDKALEFIETGRNRPFYLSVHYTAPHTPWTGHPQRWVDQYRSGLFASFPVEPKHPWASALQDHLGNRESMAQYAASITAMDQNIGRILERLDNLSLRQDTLIVFTSDHGFNFGHHGLVGKGNASTPRNMYDTSLLVPLIFSHPARLRGKQQIDALVSAYDFLPTLLDYLALPPPRQRNLPGQSYAPLLAGKQISWQRDVYGEYGKVRMVRSEDWKYVHRYPAGPHELYDLKNDPGEKNNLADDSAAQGRALELHKRLEAWFARYVEPLADPVGPVVAGK